MSFVIDDSIRSAKLKMMKSKTIVFRDTLTSPDNLTIMSLRSCSLQLKFTTRTPSPPNKL
jgi:hypothetical protein